MQVEIEGRVFEVGFSAMDAPACGVVVPLTAELLATIMRENKAQILQIGAVDMVHDFDWRLRFSVKEVFPASLMTR